MTTPPPPDAAKTEASWRRWGALALELALMGALVILAALTLPAVHGGGGGDLPLWATPHDAVLDGPDAGEWAANALHAHRGDWSSLDIHRAPTWLMLTAVALFVQPDVALAGHGVNHLALLLLPLVVYGLGRAGGGPGAGFIAGAFVVACEPLIIASRRYGVDAVVALVLPLALLAALPVKRRWWLAPLAGAVAGLACLSHFTALPYFLPPLLLIALRGPKGWRRPAALVLHLAGAAAMVWLVSHFFPLASLDELRVSVSEGVAKGESVGAVGLSAAAEATLLQNASQAAPAAIRDALAPLWHWWMSWEVLLALPWIGALGLGLGVCNKPDGDSLRERAVAGLSWADLGLGLALLSCLAPLPVLAAAGAEPRYAANLLPFVAVLLARGLASPLALLGGLLRLRWVRLPKDALVLIPAWTMAWTAWHSGAPLRTEPLPPLGQLVAAQELGAHISAHMPGPGGAASPMREAAAHAGRDFCPATPCPSGSTESDFLACVASLDAQCPGEGPIPYVVMERWEGPIGQHEAAMGAWARERYGTLATVQRGPLKAHLVGLPRPSEEAP